MNDQKKAKLKDDILKILIENKTNDHVNEISSELKVDVRLVSYLSEELAKDGLVKLIEVSSITTGVFSVYILRITNKGLYFLTYDGGYYNEFKKNRKKTIWIVVKTVAAILNAIAILIIGAYSLLLNDKVNRLEKENERLKTEIQNNHRNKIRFQ